MAAGPGSLLTGAQEFVDLENDFLDVGGVDLVFDAVAALDRTQRVTGKTSIL
jgi:hypothetical protein